MVFTLGELDAAFGNEQILVADKRDGKPLFGYQGPFRLVCPNDKAGARSVRMLETLEFVRLAEIRERHARISRSASLIFALSLDRSATRRGAGPSRLSMESAQRLPQAYVPADNPMTAAKVELGRYLFYDTRMSVNGKASCATCHKQELAFTDGRAVGLGATGELHSRSAMSLVNVAYSAALTWSNPQIEETGGTGAGADVRRASRRAGLARRRWLSSECCVPIQNTAALFERAFPGDADRFTVAQRHQSAGQLREEHHLGPFAL